MFSTLFIICLGLLSVTRPSESQRRGGPRVITQPQIFEADAGTSITLPCSIRNVGRRSVFWFKGDAPQGRELIMQMKSVRGQFTVTRQYQEKIDMGKLSTDGSNLIINNLDASDEDAYTCSIAWARQSVTHSLTVIGDAPATPAPELFLTAVPSDGQVSVGEGLPAVLSCVASSNLPTTISWNKEGAPDILSVGSVLNFFDSSRDDSGRYVCTAENGVSEPISFYFDLAVEYVEVRTDDSEVVASGEDLMAQLSCHISGFPQPQVAWYTSVGPIVEDSRHLFFTQDNTHYLQLQQMTSADLGEYQCYGYNDKSRDHATILVTSAPGPVNVLGVVPSPRGEDRYTLTWEVNSLAPIRFYYVALREGKSDEVTSMSVEGSSVPNDGRRNLYRGSTEFDVIPGHTYEIMVKAVAEEYQPGPDQLQPYIFTAPYAQEEPATIEYIHNDAEENFVAAERAESPPGSEINNEDAWKWWKVTMTLMSRLPQLARIMQ